MERNLKPFEGKNEESAPTFRLVDIPKNQVVSVSAGRRNLYQGSPKKTYENLFQRKKAYEEVGPTALRRVPSPDPIDFPLHSPGNPNPHLTKVITHTVSELEEEEHSRNAKKKETIKTVKESCSGGEQEHAKQEAEPLAGSIPSLSILRRPPSMTIPGIHTTSTKSSIPIRKLHPKGKIMKKTSAPRPTRIVTIIEEPKTTCSTSSISSTENNENRNSTEEMITNVAGPPEYLSSETVSGTSTASSQSSSCASKIPYLTVIRPKQQNKLRKSMRGVGSKAGDLVSSTVAVERMEKTSRNDPGSVDIVMDPQQKPHINRAHVKDSTRENVCHCQECKRYKQKLRRSQNNNQYLVQLLQRKESDLLQVQKVQDASCHIKTDVASSTEITKTKDCATNTRNQSCSVDLVATLSINSLAETRKGSPTSSTKVTVPLQRTNASPRAVRVQNRATSTTSIPYYPCAIPKFDLDEFIRKFSEERTLLSDSCSGHSYDEHQDIQSLRVSLAARECLTQIVKHKLKHGYHILKGRYESFLSLRSSADKPQDDSYYIEVLDSYRRFVRFIYYYLKTSMVDIDKFEAKCSSLQKPPFEGQDYPHSKPKLKHSYETTMVIDGKRYFGVFIPVRAAEGI